MDALFSHLPLEDSYDAFAGLMPNSITHGFVRSRLSQTKKEERLVMQNVKNIENRQSV